MRQRRIGRLGRALVGSATVATLLFVAAVPVAAHEHYAANGQAGDGQVLANGQNHPKFLSDGPGTTTYSSCESYGPVPGGTIGPVWYGLETAHHGPDSGTPGKGDGCYTADGSPGSDVQNPAIR